MYNKSKEQIKQYLKSQPWFNSYAEYVKETIYNHPSVDLYLDMVGPDLVISGGLIWENTKEGWETWKDRNEEYKSWLVETD